MVPDSSVRIQARAKLNLSLRVLARRPDGYHDILTWMQPIDWHDDLRVKRSGRAGFSLTCDDPSIDTGPSNLVCRAAAALATRLDRPLAFEAHLSKRIAVGGGLGGGSADAAAAILAIGRFWGLGGAAQVLDDAAGDVGTDVPFFLGEGSAVARDRGTLLERQRRAFQGWAVLILPPFGVSTPDVYQACRPRPLHQEEQSPWQQPWTTARDLDRLLCNDLTSAACEVEPRLAGLHGAIAARAGARVHMSGGGSTLFALFDTQEEAREWELSLDRPIDARTRVARVLDEPPCVACGNRSA